MVSARKIIEKLTHAINLKILIAFSIQHLYECNFYTLTLQYVA